MVICWITSFLESAHSQIGHRHLERHMVVESIKSETLDNTDSYSGFFTHDVQNSYVNINDVVIKGKTDYVVNKSYNLAYVDADPLIAANALAVSIGIIIRECDNYEYRYIGGDIQLILFSCIRTGCIMMHCIVRLNSND